MINYFSPSVSEETFAAWLDGTLSIEEENNFLKEYDGNAEIEELLSANDQVDESYEQMIQEGYELPDELNGDFPLPDIYHYDVEPYDVEPYDVEPYDDEEEDGDSTTDDLDDNLHHTDYDTEFDTDSFDI